MGYHEGIKSAISDYMSKNKSHFLGVKTMPEKAQNSTASLWKNQKADSSLRLYGSLQITEDLLQRLLETPPNDYGQYELKIALFRNDSDNTKAPLLRGKIELPRTEWDDEF